MSPPAATFDAPVTATVGNGLSLKKDLAVKAVGTSQSRTLAEMEDKWDSFTFSPIRESQVSRAMSEFVCHFDSSLVSDIYSSSLLRRLGQLRRV
jgi:thiamine thiazole synthase